MSPRFPVVWWRLQRARFDLYVSQFVLDEIGRGDPEVALKRVATVKGIPLLDINDDVLDLAEGLVGLKIIPAKAGTDALHIALAAVHGMDFLLSWNCKHIANAAIVRAVEADQRKANALRESLQASITLAKERRAALITAAVTGQIRLE